MIKAHLSTFHGFLTLLQDNHSWQWVLSKPPSGCMMRSRPVTLHAGYAMLNEFQRNCIPLFYHLFKRLCNNNNSLIIAFKFNSKAKLQHRWIKTDKTCWLQACGKLARQKKKKKWRNSKCTFSVVGLSKALLTPSNILSCSMPLTTPGSFVTHGLQRRELSESRYYQIHTMCNQQD